MNCSTKELVPRVTPSDQNKSSTPPDVQSQETSGLPEIKRKQIAEEIINASNEVNKKVHQKYPFKISEIAKNAQRLAMIKKRNELAQSLWEGSIQTIAGKYDLTITQVKDIEYEGIDKGWIKYPELPTIYK